MGILDEFDMKRHLNVVLPASSIWHSSGHDVDSIAFSRAIRLGSAPIYTSSYRNLSCSCLFSESIYNYYLCSPM